MCARSKSARQLEEALKRKKALIAAEKHVPVELDQTIARLSAQVGQARPRVDRDNKVRLVQPNGGRHG